MKKIKITFFVIICSLIFLRPEISLAKPFGWLGGIYWDFSEDNLENLYIVISFNNVPETSQGLYFCTLQGKIGDWNWKKPEEADEGGFYFGFQTNVMGTNKKGVIFSRWGSKLNPPNSCDVKVPPGSFSQIADYEGSFVGARRNYCFVKDRIYIMSLRLVDNDSIGGWYKLDLIDYTNGAFTYLGMLRFRRNPDGTIPRIKPWCLSWIEHYTDDAINQEEIKFWDISILMVASKETVPRLVTTTYPSELTNSNISYAPGPPSYFNIKVGKNVLRTHPASSFIPDWEINFLNFAEDIFQKRKDKKREKLERTRGKINN